MRLLDEQYTKVLFYGVRRLRAWLRAQGNTVNPKRVRVLTRRGFRLFIPTRGVVFLQGLGYRLRYDVYSGHLANNKSVDLGILNAQNNNRRG